MVSLEQVQLLETRVSKAIEYVKKISAENATLVSERAGLQKKLDANQKRIDELEVLVMRFKEDQGRIEDGIVAALDRLSQFEEAFENSLKEKVLPEKPPAKPRGKSHSSEASAEESEIFFEIPQASAKSGQPKTAERSSSQPKEAAKGKPADDDFSPEDELDIF